MHPWEISRHRQYVDLVLFVCTHHGGVTRQSSITPYTLLFVCTYQGGVTRQSSITPYTLRVRTSSCYIRWCEVPLIICTTCRRIRIYSYADLARGVVTLQ